LQAAEPVGDAPMASAQLHSLAALILDAHVVGPDIVIFGRRGLVLEIERLHRHLDGPGRFGIHDQTLRHAREPRRSILYRSSVASSSPWAMPGSWLWPRLPVSLLRPRATNP